ncbi:MAG: hypothetical protein EOO43_05675 [Flavobacterium sp.]|nr:MAG: hypothetical protein EOO43_05675 [Flavobacterium sp.]
MGSFSYLTIGDYPILSVKNDFSSSVIEHIFQPEDFIVEKRKRSSMNVLYWGEVKDRGSYNFKGFRQTVRVCMDRLKIYGMSMQESKKNFDLAKRFAAEQGEYSFPMSNSGFARANFCLVVYG